MSSSTTRAEIDAFESMLKMMGVDNYDTAVITALSEYTRRFASEILTDAKDYSQHAGHSEIDIADIKLAINLLDSRTTGINNKLKCIHEAADDINSRPLPLINTDNLLGIQSHDLLRRTFSFVAGCEAYPEPDDISQSKLTTSKYASIPTGKQTGHGLKRSISKITINPNIGTSQIAINEDFNETYQV